MPPSTDARIRICFFLHCDDFRDRHNTKEQLALKSGTRVREGGGGGRRFHRRFIVVVIVVVASFSLLLEGGGVRGMARGVGWSHGGGQMNRQAHADATQSHPGPARHTAPRRRGRGQHTCSKGRRPTETRTTAPRT